MVILWRPLWAASFDGIGGFPLAAVRNGITPVWASEIEPFCVRVTKHHFPGMLHTGNITQLRGAELPPVDVITGGSPCQDLSVASGHRAGLAGERSGLFMEQIRITKEMRDESRRCGRTAVYVQPRYMCWENVPGAMSSGTPPREDFRVVLEEIIRIADSGLFVPRPPGGRWQPAGAVLGDQFSLAWRILDTQYWLGTPQRRRRIFLVCDFNGFSAPKILFDTCRLQGDSAPGRGAGKETAAATGVGAPPAGGPGRIGNQAQVAYACNQRDEVRNLHDVAAALCASQTVKQQTFIMSGCLTPWDVQSVRIVTPDGTAPTLSGCDGKGGRKPGGLVFCLNDQGGQRMDIYEDQCGTLRAQMDGHPPLIFENHGIDARYTGPHEVAPTLSHRGGTGGGNLPLMLQEKTWCIAGNTIDREPENGGNGIGVQEGIAYTITAADRHSVYARQRVDVFQEKAVASTQSARQHKDATDLVYQETVGALGYSDHKGVNNQYVSEDKLIVEGPLLIRRLLPSECELLMGYPLGWTDIPADGGRPGASDSARYRALGNSVSIPCVEFVMRGIAYFLNHEG